MTAASGALYARRSELCAEHQIGLTKLYNLMDEGGFADLKKLHLDLDLDRAVVAAYGWPESIAQGGAELVRLHTERNQEIAEGARRTLRSDRWSEPLPGHGRLTPCIAGPT